MSFQQLAINYIPEIAGIVLFIPFGTTIDALNAYRKALVLLGLGNLFPKLREEIKAKPRDKGSSPSWWSSFIRPLRSTTSSRYVPSFPLPPCTKLFYSYLMHPLTPCNQYPTPQSISPPNGRARLRVRSELGRAVSQLIMQSKPMAGSFGRGNRFLLVPTPFFFFCRPDQTALGNARRCPRADPAGVDTFPFRRGDPPFFSTRERACFGENECSWRKDLGGPESAERWGRYEGLVRCREGCRGRWGGRREEERGEG